MRLCMVVMIAVAAPSLLFAAQEPAPAQKPNGTASKAAVRDEKNSPSDATAAVPGKAEPRKSIGLSAKQKAKKKAMRAGAAKGRADFQSALQQQQAIAGQNAILQQNQLLQQQQAQQSQEQQLIRRIMPQGQTVVTVNPDGTYTTKTYYFYPTPIVPPVVNPPMIQPSPSP